MISTRGMLNEHVPLCLLPAFNPHGMHVFSGRKGIFIHTSGTAVLADGSKSEFASDTVFSDQDPVLVEQLPDSQMHKIVDDWIRAYTKDITAIVVCPPLIYGEAGDPARSSGQIPMICRAMCKCDPHQHGKSQAHVV